MIKNKHLIIQGILLFFLSFIWINPAIAMTQNWSINSDRGYRIETSFSYPATSEQKMIAEEGETAKIVDSLTVRFYDPEGKMIASYDNIIDGIIQNNYFKFNYDLQNQKLMGQIDLGGESVGEIYLKGNPDQGLSLIRVEPSGEEKEIDQVGTYRDASHRL